MKILTILGARPQFVKAAMFSQAVGRFKKAHPHVFIDEIIIHTGQHFDENMSGVFFKELGVPEPKYNLDIHGGGHASMTGRMMCALEPLLQSEQPDCIVVFGDTNTTLAGAVVGAKMHIPIVHIEAGLRSYDRRMPEEMNRVVVDQLSSLLFCPTMQSMKNLEQEGLNGEHAPKNIHCEYVGDVMLDTFLANRDKTPEISSIDGLATDLTDNFILATVHREENTDDLSRLGEIVTGLESIAKDIPVILPCHPRTLQAMKKHQLSFKHVHAITPVSYTKMLALIQAAKGVITDSGGLQKEAFFCQKPCVIIRGSTEWTEQLDTGASILVEASVTAITDALPFILKNTAQWDLTIYGDGRAADKMVHSIVKNLYCEQVTEKDSAMLEAE